MKQKKDKLDYEALSDCYAKIIDRKNDELDCKSRYMDVIDKLLDETLEINQSFIIENQTLKNNFLIMVITASLLLIGLIIK